MTVKWRGKPVFIRRRTPEEIEAVNAVDVASLRDPQADSERIRAGPEWMVVVGPATCRGATPKDVMSTRETGARIALDDVAGNIWLTLGGGGGVHAPGLRAHRQRR